MGGNKKNQIAAVDKGDEELEEINNLVNGIIKERKKNKMKRYYTTESPDRARHILLETEGDAIEQARRQVESGENKRRYVVEIIGVVEPIPVPRAKYTRMKD